MDKKTLVQIVLVILALVAALFFVVGDDTDSSALVDENLQASNSEESREVHDAIAAGEKTREIAHAHVEPGVYSEIYYTVSNLTPGTTFTATLYEVTGDDEDLVNDREQEVYVDELGVARFVWRITQFGDYAVSDEIAGAGSVLMYTVE